MNQIYNANPERVVKKILSNPNYVEVVSQYVGPEKMREMIAGYVENGLGKSFDPVMGFRPSVARNWIYKNREFLEKYLGPQYFERMSALADYGYLGKRFLDEVNPSGTAASLKNMIEPGGFFQKVKQGQLVGAVTSATVGAADTAIKQRSAKKFLDKSLNPNAKKLRSGSDPLFLPGKADDNLGKLKAGAAFSKTRSDDDQKGPKKWQAQGEQALLKVVPKSIVEKLKDSPEGQKLLIEASNAKPGSKRMKAILKKLEGMKQ